MLRDLGLRWFPRRSVLGSVVITLLVISSGRDLQAQFWPQLTVAYPDNFRDAARCVADCFTMTAQYSTPAYITQNTPQGITLVYHSDRTRPIATIQVDATVVQSTPPDTYSLLIKRPDGSLVTLRGGLQEVFFVGGPGTTRLVAQFDA